jgi:rhodanese-related sulfurtransferase
MATHIHPNALYECLGLTEAPLLVDVRSKRDMDRTPHLIPGALHFDADDARQWVGALPQRRDVVLYGAGSEPATALATLVSHGMRACILDGGFDSWREHRYPTIRIRTDLGVPGHSQWVTRERPKIDRLACPWLVRRFIDPQATFFYVPAQQVRAQATALGAQPYDIADVTFSHRGPRCSFDAFLDEFELRDPVLETLAHIVRAADTGALEQSREAPGLLAISLGLSAAIPDDQLLLERAMLVYDALYAWCKKAHDESHSWPKKVAGQ